MLELFYDLFFAANYTVFSETQGVNSADRFKAYVGYFTYESELLYEMMMKLTYRQCPLDHLAHDRSIRCSICYGQHLWYVMIVILLRTLLTVIERVARGIHLGVMVGFAVVAPKFKPEDQDMRTMRTFCEYSS